MDEAVNKLMLTTAISKTAWETVNQVNFEFGKKIVYLEANVDGLLLARKAAEKQWPIIGPTKSKEYFFV